MKIRTLIVSVLAILVVSSVSPAQVAGTPEQEPQEPAFTQSDSPSQAQPETLFVTQAPSPTTPRPEAPMSRRQLTRTPGVLSTPPMMNPISAPTPTEVKIIELKYVQAADMSEMIYEVFRIPVYFVEGSNRLIINATYEQMKSILSVIEQMDVPNVEASTSRNIQNLVYRIYMFEIASGDEGMKPFSMILQVPPEVFTTQLFDAAARPELQISGFCLSDEGDRDGKTEILIHGKAASDMTLKRMVVDDIPESQIKELKWDDAETFTNEIAAAHYMQLPEQMQKHIAKFLGEDIRTVGYWFGNLSVPGEVEAPIGPWTLKLRLNTEPDHMLELNVDVEAPAEISPFEIRLGRERKDEILSNTIRAKIGKPIIIGYNRESYGTRKMGAMVIIPEVDMVQLEENKSKF